MMVRPIARFIDRIRGKASKGLADKGNKVKPSDLNESNDLEPGGTVKPAVESREYGDGDEGD